MKRRILLYILMALLRVAVVSAQQVTFVSPGFEQGVKMHLGLDSAAVVTQAQTDTITAIDLSGLGITDVRDVVHLPAVQRLNLAFNDIRDVAPLAELDSLHYLDLRGNGLKNIDMLAWACSDSMVVNVAHNHILDFGRMLLPTRCRFTFAGRYAQTDPNAPYIDVYQLYTDFVRGRQHVFYRAYSNDFYVQLGWKGTGVSALADGNLNSYALSFTLTEPLLVRLGAGDVRGDSVWVLPPLRLQVGDGASVVVDTRLPDDYAIVNLGALHGAATADSMLTITYQAPATAVPDTISFVIYQRHHLRGFAQYYVNSRMEGDVNDDRQVDIDDLNIVINIMVRKATLAAWPAADINGDGVVDVDDMNYIINILVRKRLALTTG